VLFSKNVYFLIMYSGPARVSHLQGKAIEACLFNSCYSLRNDASSKEERLYLLLRQPREMQSGRPVIHDRRTVVLFDLLDGRVTLRQQICRLWIRAQSLTRCKTNITELITSCDLSARTINKILGMPPCTDKVNGRRVENRLGLKIRELPNGTIATRVAR